MTISNCVESFSIEHLIVFSFTLLAVNMLQQQTWRPRCVKNLNNSLLQLAGDAYSHLPMTRAIAHAESVMGGTPLLSLSLPGRFISIYLSPLNKWGSWWSSEKLRMFQAPTCRIQKVYPGLGSKGECCFSATLTIPKIEGSGSPPPFGMQVSCRLCSSPVTSLRLF